MITLAAGTALALLLQLGQGGPATTPQDTLSGVDEAGISASAGVAPDTVTVGDRFRAVLRVQVPAGATIDFPEFRMEDPVQALAPVEARRGPGGGWTATYRLVAWATGDSMVAAVTLGVTDSAGARTSYRIRLPLPVVRSVLPADSALHLPRPAKAVIPIALPDGGVRGWLLPVLLLAALLSAIAWVVLRRRRGAIALPGDPRDAALARLREIDREGLLARGEIVLYHVRVSRVLREYLAVRGLGGEDQTSSELLASARQGGVSDASVRDLERLLRQADLVKFSGAYAPDPRDTGEFGAGVARWIRGWPEGALPARQEAA